ncbi:unnamed protein product [Scytosiphon promiscuus]
MLWRCAYGDVVSCTCRSPRAFYRCFNNEKWLSGGDYAFIPPCSSLLRRRVPAVATSTKRGIALPPAHEAPPLLAVRVGFFHCLVILDSAQHWRQPSQNILLATMSTTAVQPQQSGQEECPVHCTPRLTFWIVAASSWVVWMFAVAAAADDKWLSDNGEGEWMAAGEDGFLTFCDYVDDVPSAFGDNNAGDYGEICDIYKGFTAMQMLAAIVCSVAVALLTLAFFRPAVGGRASAQTLALVGGTLIATYALFQLVAVTLGGVIMQKANDLSDESEDSSYFYTYDDYFTPAEPGYNADVGPTFAVAVSGLILAIAASILLLLFARRAGDGPLYSCFSSLMLANRSAGGTHKVDGGGGYNSAPPVSQPRPLPPAASTVDAAPAAAAAPQYHHEEAGLPPPPEPESGSAVGEQQHQEELPSYEGLPPAKQ